METTVNAKPRPAPATASEAKPLPPSAPPVATIPPVEKAASLPWTEAQARPRPQARQPLRLLDGFVIALTAATACSLFAAAANSDDSHSRELLPTVVMTTAR